MNPYRILALAFALLALVIVGLLDVQQQNDDTGFYCEMVAIWHANAEAPAALRPGWPPYRNDVECK